VGTPKETVRVCKVETRIYGSTQCSDCLKIAPVRNRDEAVRKAGENVFDDQISKMLLILKPCGRCFFIMTR
jgi:hypothetical protein